MTLLLSAVLMAALWEVSSSYIRLFELGQEKAAESRLARAVLDQIAEDLNGIANVSLLKKREDIALPLIKIDSSNADSNGADSESEGEIPSLFGSDEKEQQVPQFSLIGSSQQLVINTHVTKLPKLEFDSEEESLQGSSTAGSSSDIPSGSLDEFKLVAPELMTVVYDFTDSSYSETESQGLPIGLIRRELDWQSHEPDDEGGLGDDSGETESLSAESETYLSDDDLEEMELSEIISADLENEAFLWVPEMTRLKFRYFDGSSWGDSWDSEFRGALPFAIEVSFDMDFYQGLDARYPLEEEENLEIKMDDDSSEEEEEELSDEEGILEQEEEPPLFSRLILLNTSGDSEKPPEEKSSIDDLIPEDE